MEEGKPQQKKFKDYSEENKKKIIEKARTDKKKPEGIFVIVECHPKCKIYQDLPEYRFIVNPKDKLKEIDGNVRKKVTTSQKQFATQSIFLFSQTKVLNIETSIEELYSKHKNFKDDVLYLYFANVEAF